MDKKLALDEVHKLMKQTQLEIGRYLNDKEEDADKIGTLVEELKSEIEDLKFVESVIENWPEEYFDDYFIANTIMTLAYGKPLTALRSDEEAPEEWNGNYNVRWPQLYYKMIKTESGKEIKEYSDVTRITMYDILENRNIRFKEISDRYGRNIAVHIMHLFDSIVPIEFPYYLQENRVKFFIELFDSKVDDEHTLSTFSLLYFTNAQTKEEGKKAEAVLRFFDISDNKFEEIDKKVYTTRRQIHDRNVAEKEVKNDEEGSV